MYRAPGRGPVGADAVLAEGIKDNQDEVQVGLLWRERDSQPDQSEGIMAEKVGEERDGNCRSADFRRDLGGV